VAAAKRKSGERDMSLKRSPMISAEETLKADEVSLKRLRDVVAGRDGTVPRSQAMALLQISGFPDRHRDFEAVLEDENESAVARYLAAASLRNIATPTAMEILLKNTCVRDERVLSSVLNALACIGDESALDAILKVRERAEGLAASQAEFAASLIVHRLGLNGPDYPPPEIGDHLELKRHCARPIRVSKADEAEVELCLSSLASQPFGIEFAENSMLHARCGRNTWMIVLNKEFSDKTSVVTLAKRKGFFGVVAIRDEQSRSYSVAYLILTSPAKHDQSIDVLIYRISGQLCFTGIAQVAGNGAEFSILALQRPGAVAVKIDGTFKDGRLEIVTALSTAFVQVKKREPTAELQAEHMVDREYQADGQR
jgi:hypothetical protein